MQTDTQDKRRYLRAEEAAAELRCHPDTLRRHIRSAALPALRIAGSGSYLIRRSALAAFLHPTDVDGAA